MNRNLLVTIILLLASPAFGQNFQPTEEKTRELQSFTQILSQGNTDNGVLFGLKYLKAMKNASFRKGWRALIGIDKMERNPELPGDHFEFHRMINLGYEFQYSAIKRNRLSIWIQGLVGFTLMNERIRGIDYESNGVVGYFSMEPGLSLSYQVQQQWNLFFGSSYILQTESSELVNFNKLNWNFGIGFKL